MSTRKRPTTHPAETAGAIVARTVSPELAAAAEAAKPAVNALVLTAQALVVSDFIGYTDAADFLRRIKTGLADVERRFAPIIDPQYQALEAAYALRREISQPLLRAEEIVKKTMGDYKLVERQRLQAEECARLQREQQARLEWQRQQMLNATATIGTPPVAVTYSHAAPSAPAASATGVSDRVSYTAVVTDLAALVRAVADGLAPDGLVQVNDQLLQRIAKNPAMRAILRVLPGVELREDVTISARGY